MKHFTFVISLFFYFQGNTQTYNIHFFQSGKEQFVVNEQLTLEKKPFQIQVELLQVDGVFVSCSKSDSLYRIPLTEGLPEPEFISEKVVVEPENNTDMDLIVSNDSYSYWFYNPKIDTWHRFDPNPIIKKDRVIGTKTIASFFISENYNEQNETISVSDIEQALYLTFFLMNENKKGEKYDEQRIRVKLNWR